MRLRSVCQHAAVLAFIFFCAANAFGQTVIHVAPGGDDSADGSADHPVKTLHRAQHRIVELRANGGSRWARVEIAPGEYLLDAPLTIAADASGESLEHPVTYAASGGEVRITGGVRITGFRQDSKQWVASIPKSVLPFRDLWVNGRRAVRARTPNLGFYRIHEAGPDNRTSFAVEPSDYLSLADPQTAEVVFLHDWSISRVRLSSIDAAARSYKFADPIGADSKNFTITNFEAHPRYFVENAAELLDAPGEWFLDEAKGELRYVPRDGEEIETAEFIAPRLEQLLTIRGETEKPVEHICFEGLTLSYARFDIPSHGYGGVQATLHEKRLEANDRTKTFPTAAVMLDHVSDCHFKNCRFEHLAGTGLSATHCQDTRIERSTFSDIGGNGVMIGSLSSADTPIAERNTVENCTIESCGQTFFGAIGAWVGMSVDTTLRNNEIRNLPYTGISVGWCWDARPTICRGHQIRNNNIHHVMQTLSDGGGIYTLGRQPGTVLDGNVIHDISINSGRAESNGIFMDEGSTEIQVENNTFYGIARAAIRYNEAGKNTVANNRLDGAAGSTWLPPADDASVKQAGPRP
jgi:Right handed beta helix region